MSGDFGKGLVGELQRFGRAHGPILEPRRIRRILLNSFVVHFGIPPTVSVPKAPMGRSGFTQDNPASFCCLLIFGSFWYLRLSGDCRA